MVTVPPGDTVLAIGGPWYFNSTVERPLTLVEMYDPETNSWTDMEVSNEGLGSGLQFRGTHSRDIVASFKTYTVRGLSCLSEIQA